MSLTSGTYFVFLIAIFFAYWLVADRARWRIVLLALAGCLFYSQVGWQGLCLLASLTVVDFTTTRLMRRTDSARMRRLLLAFSLASDIGVLCVFKYADFFVEAAAGGLSLFGLDVTIGQPGLIAPMGISFIVFQSLAYVIDVYRRDTEPAQSYQEYLAFISFFPTVIAGPILRAKQLLPQLQSRVRLDPATGGQALFLIAVGLIKKIAVADYLSANLVDRVFDFPERFSSLEVLAAVYGYAFQIYADFSGYSDIAIGSALLLGLRLPANFDAPYRSRSLTEFWRRWHISLSTWLRDYLFFTVAGKRVRSGAALYFGIVITMLVGGLWHGPTWTFVLWGALHGAGLVIARWFMNVRKRHPFLQFNSRASDAAGLFLTFHFVCFAWVFFRADGLDRALAVLNQMAGLTVDTSNLALPVLLVMALAAASHSLPASISDKAQKGFSRLPSPVQASMLFALAVGLYMVASSDVVPFIYSRF
ncbi:MAG TPA: MBOAT family O-acyltransferase [Blastocatellia bacterium]|nr:MBOAT family O-acyltransferase [Blastocatellia bacterium]